MKFVNLIFILMLRICNDNIQILKLILYFYNLILIIFVHSIFLIKEFFFIFI